MTVKLTAEQLASIRRHGEADYPHECCGLMIGSFAADGGKLVEEIYPISNAREESAKRNRFLITPAELLRGEKHARSLGHDIVGIYHSHPDHPARPSQFDLDHAWPVFSYVIVAVDDGRAQDLLSWELRADRSRFDAEAILEGA